MSSPSPGQLNHDTVARLLDMTPAELTKLVDRGVIPRIDRNAYALGPVVHAYINHLRDEQGRADRNPTQAEIAAHLDISDRRLRELLTELGLDHKTVPLAEIRLRYIRKLREEAAGRAASGDLDLASERARLAKEQADRIAMQNAVTRGELAPAHLIEQVLAKVGSKVARLLETIPGLLKRRLPDLTSADIQAVREVIARARNMAAQISLETLKESEDDDDNDVEVAEADEA